MQFLITAYDGTDSQALNRRLKAREKHLEHIQKLLKERKILYAAAILDDDGSMIGSTLFVDFPSKDSLKSEWLDSEPYVTGNVWQEIDIKPCKIPEFFLNQ